MRTGMKTPNHCDKFGLRMPVSNYLPMENRMHILY